MLHSTARFSLGRLLITPAARAALTEDDVKTALRQHLQGNWGLVEAEDWQANEAALRDGARLLSVYEANGACRFWVITEWNRAYTTVLLPEDY